MDLGSGSSLEKTTESVDGASPRMTGITVGKSVEFPYEGLAVATNYFGLDSKIGQGGFGSVFYAEIQDEVCDSVILLL